MPHKRAKRSVRDTQRASKGIDLAPTQRTALDSEPLPKSFVRALNAEKVRAEYREKRKRAEEEGPDERKKRKKLDSGVQDSRIRPGETLAHFNKRIEADMRPLVRSAVQASNAAVRAEKKKTTGAKEPKTQQAAKSTKKQDSVLSDSQPKPASESPIPDRPIKDFARVSTAAPRRLNDIAQAPPDMLSLGHARRAEKLTGMGKKKKDVISPAQQLALEAARLSAVAKYREIKAARLAEKTT